MLKYIKRELASFGEGSERAVEVSAPSGTTRTRRKKETTHEGKEIPVKTDSGMYCYRNEQRIETYAQEVKAFTLGVNTPMYAQDFDKVIYYAELANEAMPTIECTGFKQSDTVTVVISGVGQINGVQVLNGTYVWQKSGQNIVVWTDRVDNNIKIMFVGILTPGTQITGDLTVKVIGKDTRGLAHKYTLMPSDGITNPFICTTRSARERTRENRRNRVRKREPRIIISERVDGYWKIVRESMSIDLRFSIKAYGTMGGMFNNHLVDSGFEKTQLNYTYQRDGETVRAITVTYVTPNDEAGMYVPSMSQTSYNGKFKVMAPGSLIEVWYTEDRWQVNNAIYAKDFATDSQARGEITSTQPLIFRMNYVAGFDIILNTPGKIDYQYYNGGFAQLDADGYTGLAIIIRFICTGPKYRSPEREFDYMPIGDERIPYLTTIGKWSHMYTDDHTQEKINSQVVAGFGAGYPEVIKQHNMTVSYTVLRPSDPEFVTGGDQYQQSITSELEVKIRDLQQQLNDLNASINIGNVTAGAFEFLTNIQNLPSLFSNFTEVFSNIMKTVKQAKAKPKVKSYNVAALRRKGRNRKVLGDYFEFEKAKLIDDSIFDQIDDAFKFLDEDSVGSVLYSTIKEAIPKYKGRADMQVLPLAIAMDVELPVVAKTGTLSNKFKDWMRNKGMDIESSDLIEVDTMNKSLSMVGRKNKDILKYKIDNEMINEILSEVATSRNRSLFSLNMRKQIGEMKYGRGNVTMERLLDSLMNDKELIDISRSLSPQEMVNIFDEIAERIRDSIETMV
ncbi:outer capsid spike protein VP4 [Rotavirus G]|nr:outer capsid spike protein VP4 [Rotavirus G]